jgi:hypothetical protein
MKNKRFFMMLPILAVICWTNVTAQCPLVNCGLYDSSTGTYVMKEFFISIDIPDVAYLPVIVDTNENCYITLQAENQQFNSVLAEYDILGFYKYIDGIPSLENVYCIIVDSTQQMALYEELVEKFSDVFPRIHQSVCKLGGWGIETIQNHSHFWQEGNNLVFGSIAENTRIINFYSLLGVKISTLQSMEKVINLSPYLKQIGIYIVEVTENNQRYSLKINFLNTY